jgi:hypothetical protein
MQIQAQLHRERSFVYHKVALLRSFGGIIRVCLSTFVTLSRLHSVASHFGLKLGYPYYNTTGYIPLISDLHPSLYYLQIIAL